MSIRVRRGGFAPTLLTETKRAHILFLRAFTYRQLIIQTHLAVAVIACEVADELDDGCVGRTGATTELLELGRCS